MGAINKLSVLLIVIILFIGFITGDMGTWGAILTVIVIPMFVHGGYILFNGQDDYKLYELRMHPEDTNYKYDGNGKYTHTKTGTWIQYNDYKEQEYWEGTNVKSLFKLYGVILVLAIVVMQFSSTGISKQDVYDDVKERVMENLGESYSPATISSKSDTDIVELDKPKTIEVNGEDIEAFEDAYNVKGVIKFSNEILPFSYDVYYLKDVDGPVIIGGVR